MEVNGSYLSPYFVTGLVEGEGCFSVSFSYRKKLKLGIETRPSFSISLNRRDLNLLKKVYEFFKRGSIRFSKSDNNYKYEVRSVSDLIEKIIPHFQKFPLQGGKANDFRIFTEICKDVRSNLHRNRKHLPIIIEKAYQMNPSGKRRYEAKDLLRILDELKV